MPEKRAHCFYYQPRPGRGNSYFLFFHVDLVKTGAESSKDAFIEQPGESKKRAVASEGRILCTPGFHLGLPSILGCELLQGILDSVEMFVE